MAGESWKEMPLGDFLTLQRGHDLPDSRRHTGQVPILGSFGVTGWHDEAKAPGPGVTVGRSGASFGVVSYSAVEYWPLNTALYVIDFHGNDERFAYYFLKQFDFRSYNSGSAQPSLNRNFVHPVPVEVPSLPEQRAIPNILGTLDDKIELNRRMNETLEAMARAIFKSWFVDFLPVRAKMAAKQDDPSLLLPQAELNVWFVYAIECSDGTLYIGQTEDLRQRWLQHVGSRGASWTKHHPPVRVPYWERQPSREAAVERENWLKTGFGRKWLKKEIAARTQTGDPVRAKAEGRAPLSAVPGTAQAGGLPQPLTDLFPDSFEDSALGEIPKGWQVGTLADFSALNPESWSKETRSALINYVDLSNTKWGRIESVTAYAQGDAPSRAQRVLRPRDTIVGTVRPGNGSYALVSDDGLTGSTGFAVLRPTHTACAEFVYLAPTAAENIEALAHLADGGAYPAVRPEVVAATQIISPRNEVLVAFSRVAGPLLGKLAGNERQSRTLAALRDTLLPKLISGELRVKSAKGLLEESTE